MKRGTPRHPKVVGLAVTLKMPKYAVVGLLEMLWHFAAEFALDGGIGKFSDAMIGEALCWDGCSTMLVDALADAGWIDRCRCHRLRVHDWPNHADQTVQRVLINRNQVFLPCYDDASTILEPSKLPLPKALSLKPKANTGAPTRDHIDKNFKTESDRECFDAFWKLYPRRKAKLDAQKAWKQTTKTRPAIDVLIGAIRRQLRDPQWQKGIIPLPASWLRGERWNDEPEKGGGGAPPQHKYTPTKPTAPMTPEEKEEQARIVAEITGSGGVAAIEAREKEREKQEKE